MEVEHFLKTGDETQVRSLTDPWELTGTLLFEPQVLLDTIMMKGGTFAPLFSNVANMYYMNRSWWERHRITFQKWWEVIDDEYYPLWDKDEYEQLDEQSKDAGSSSTKTAGATTGSSDQKNSGITHDASKDSTKSQSKTYTADHLTMDQSKGEVENGVSAYDADTYQPHDKSETRDAHTQNANGFIDTATEGETVHNGAASNGNAMIGHTAGTSEGVSDSAHENEASRQHARHHWGNAGISTTAQKLMEQEFRIRAFDIYEHMADIFIDELCVRVFL